MLKVDNLVVAYNELVVLHNVSLHVNDGEFVSIIGPNGAGKTTLLKTIAGLLKQKSGTILYNGEDITRYSAYQIVEKFGIVYVPEGASSFPYLSVRENLEVARNIRRAREKFSEMLEVVYNLFPVLKERSKQLAGTLSGGERQMLAIARGLILSPCVLMLDEPSFGIAPAVVRYLFDVIKKINRELNTTVILVEQDVKKGLELASRGYVLENGCIALHGLSNDLLTSEYIKKAYLGI
jgi:branched-chain amino acid transport system ATP-binding protein